MHFVFVAEFISYIHSENGGYLCGWGYIHLACNKKSIQFAGQLSSQNWVAAGLVHGKLIIILSA